MQKLSCPTGATGNVYTQIFGSQIGQRDSIVPGGQTSRSVVSLDTWLPYGWGTEMPISRKCLNVWMGTHSEKTRLNKISAESGAIVNINLSSTHCLWKITCTFQFLLFLHAFHSFAQPVVISNNSFKIHLESHALGDVSVVHSSPWDSLSALALVGL